MRVRARLILVLVASLVALGVWAGGAPSPTDTHASSSADARFLAAPGRSAAVDLGVVPLVAAERRVPAPQPRPLTGPVSAILAALVAALAPAPRWRRRPRAVRAPVPQYLAPATLGRAPPFSRLLPV